MYSNRIVGRSVLAAAWVCVITASAWAAPMGTAFTYQGHLQQDGAPFDGVCDLQFSLWSTDAGAGQIGLAQTLLAVTVEDGLFTVALNESGQFGPDALNGDARWLQIAVRSPAGGGLYTNLSPRQPITATPYALQTRGIFVNDDASFVGVGRRNKISNVEAFGVNAPVASGYGGMYISTDGAAGWPFYGYAAGTQRAWHYLDGTDGDWHLYVDGERLTVTDEGNVGIGTTTPANKLTVDGDADLTGSLGIGTDTPQALLHVAEVFSGTGVILPGLRVEQNGLDSPNIIGGFSDNEVTHGVVGATISGGGDSSFGQTNRVTDEFGTVGGGLDNQAGDAAGATDDQRYCTVSGGWDNTASVTYATIGGGAFNRAEGQESTVAGGRANTASGNSSTVPGGHLNQAGGHYSFAAGRRAKVRDATQAGNSTGDQGTFIWADSTSADLTSTGNNQFLVRASGGMWFGSHSNPSIPAGRFLNTSTGGYLSTGGTWTNASDREAKENIEPLSTRDILKKVVDLPIFRWNYKAEDNTIKHVGPTAQDFHAAFGLGDSDKAIATIDADGVALAAIQGLHDIIREKDVAIAALRTEKDREIADLTARLERIEKMLAEDTPSQEDSR